MDMSVAKAPPINPYNGIKIKLSEILTKTAAKVEDIIKLSLLATYNLK